METRARRGDAGALAVFPNLHHGTSLLGEQSRNQQDVLHANNGSIKSPLWQRRRRRFQGCRRVSVVDCRSIFSLLSSREVIIRPVVVFCSTLSRP